MLMFIVFFGKYTTLKPNMSPENWRMEDVVSFQKGPFSGVNFPGCNIILCVMPMGTPIYLPEY